MCIPKQKYHEIILTLNIWYAFLKFSISFYNITLKINVTYDPQNFTIN